VRLRDLDASTLRSPEELLIESGELRRSWNDILHARVRLVVAAREPQDAILPEINAVVGHDVDAVSARVDRIREIARAGDVVQPDGREARLNRRANEVLREHDAIVDLDVVVVDAD